MGMKVGDLICNAVKMDLEAVPEASVRLDDSRPEEEAQHRLVSVDVDFGPDPADASLRKSVLKSRASSVLLLEFFERLTFYSVSNSLVLFFQRRLGMSNSDADIQFSVWIGMCYFLTIAGGYFADARYGRFQTVLLFSFLYLLGVSLLVVGTIPGIVEETLIFVSIYIIAVGVGGMKPNVATLGADQFDDRYKQDRKEKVSYFNWFYWSINLGAIIANTFVAYVCQFGLPGVTNQEWSFFAGYLIGVIVMVLVVLIAMVGTESFVKVEPMGSGLMVAVQICLLACKKKAQESFRWLLRRLLQLHECCWGYSRARRGDDEDHNSRYGTPAARRVGGRGDTLNGAPWDNRRPIPPLQEGRLITHSSRLEEKEWMDDGSSVSSTSGLLGKHVEENAQVPNWKHRIQEPELSQTSTGAASNSHNSATLPAAWSSSAVWHKPAISGGVNSDVVENSDDASSNNHNSFFAGLTGQVRQPFPCPGNTGLMSHGHNPEGREVGSDRSHIAYSLVGKGSGARHFLDRAKRSFGGKFSSNQVESVKLITRLLPFLAVLLPYWLIYGQMNTTFQNQGCQMNLSMLGGQIPITSLWLFDCLAILVLIPIFDRSIFPFFKSRGFAVSMLTKMGWGLLLSVLAMIVASGVEEYRVDNNPPAGDWFDVSARNNISPCQDIDEYDPTLYQKYYIPGTENPRLPSHCGRTCIDFEPDGKLVLGCIQCDVIPQMSRLSIAWQIPQFTLIGMSEVLAAVTALEFFYSQSPVHMRSVLLGVNFSTQAFGIFLGIPLIYLVNSLPKNPWISEDLNDGHLGLYFLVLAGVMLLDWGFFCYIAKGYDYKTLSDFAHYSVLEQSPGSQRIRCLQEEGRGLLSPQSQAASSSVENNIRSLDSNSGMGSMRQSFDDSFNQNLVVTIGGDDDDEDDYGENRGHFFASKVSQDTISSPRSLRSGMETNGNDGVVDDCTDEKLAEEREGGSISPAGLEEEGYLHVTQHLL